MRIIVLNSKENIYFGRKKKMPLNRVPGPFRKIRIKIQNGRRCVSYFPSDRSGFLRKANKTHEKRKNGENFILLNLKAGCVF
jgi:hypothetical protein